MFNALYGRQGAFIAGLPFVMAACLLVGSSASPSAAAGTVLSTGFEPPAFMPGVLQGQSGWVTGGSTTSSAVIQSSVKHSGSQALLVTRTANSDRRWAVPNLPGVPSHRFVTVDWDMNVAGPAGNAGAGELGPFFGVEGYDADTDIYLLGSLGVDATTGDVLYQMQDSGELTETGRTVAFNEWFHFQLVFDFLNDRYKGFVNGTLVTPEVLGFVDRAFNLNNFTDADIATFGASFDAASQALGGSAVFDNFVVRNGLVGDYDGDGAVDEADYAQWRATFGATVTPGHGADGNGNGIVDAADYVAWRVNEGLTLFPGAGSGSSSLGLESAVVPEPATILASIFALSTLALIRARGPRR